MKNDFAKLAVLAASGTLLPLGTVVQADQLYQGDDWAALASDERANALGDILTIVIAESSRSSSSQRNTSSRNSSVGGGLSAGSINESGTLEFGGSYSGRGEVVRSDQFVARMSAQIVAVLDNGDFRVEGSQLLLINGEETKVAVRGQIRKQDILSNNVVVSSRIANAHINYDGKGFVSRSAKPGLINRIFSFLGLA